MVKDKSETGKLDETEMLVMMGDGNLMYDPTTDDILFAPDGSGTKRWCDHNGYVCMTALESMLENFSVVNIPLPSCPDCPRHALCLAALDVGEDLDDDGERYDCYAIDVAATRASIKDALAGLDDDEREEMLSLC